MPGILTPNPLKFVRQHDEPLDVDVVFATTADRNAYLTDARRYAGILVVDNQEEKAYLLNAAKTAWIAVGATGDGVLDFISPAADTGIDLPSNALVKFILVKSPADTLFSLGVADDLELMVSLVSLTANIPESYSPAVFNPAAVRLLSNAPGVNVHVKIIYQIITI